MNDALRVYELQFPILDRDYLELWSTRLKVQPLWEHLKSSAEPLG
jgi:hypothetical protein